MQQVIKTFATTNGKYVYDRETNSILSLSDEEFLACRKVENSEATDDDWLVLKRHTEQGFFRPTNIKEILHPSTQFLPFYLENGMNQLTMQVTQNCNLRCSYCAYSGIYNNQRTHSNKSMQLETMYECVDFIMKRSRSVDEICLGFYGGEPLLEFDNIKKCVAYVNEKYRGRPVSFTVTTNGTCLDASIVEFLLANNFSTVISIDGPRDLHNMNRVYADGSGSFDSIIENINFVKKNYPDYFNKISFITVVAPGTDFSCINSFFSVDDVLSDSSIMVNTVSGFGASKNIAYDDLYTVTDSYQKTKILLSAIGLYSEEKTSKLFASNLSLIENLTHGLSRSGLPEKFHPSGPCVPGVMRPFVDVEGNIFPCERVSEKSPVMQIGHIKTGFNLKKIEDILNVGKLTEKECLVCWNLIHCGMCAAACDGGSYLSSEMKLLNCDAVKAKTLENLVTVCLLHEHEVDIKVLTQNKKSLERQFIGYD
ncbi:MAG: Cys-rich peptide radical SAM maturase CcpM [Oscillospiraceae bacterium]|nr:Cys-rich peptide radical SAM maturase CcpM [Oscillospiraceae bacterium]MCL2279714.1 Cys-rich peptide radical SAM maturase CcpM [Oscillospiraceae bacterium]